MKIPKVLIDTNVIMDVLTKREPHFEHSAAFLRLCGTGIMGFIAASQTTDIFYLLRRFGKTADEAKAVVNRLTENISLADVTPKDVKSALASPMSDFEDALAAQCAKRMRADFIVTRNVRDFEESPVSAITPTDFLEKFYS